MTIEAKNLPKELTKSLKDFQDCFADLRIDYWLGGGLLQKIYEAKFKDIENSWNDNDNRHDIDFFCMQENKELIEKSDFLNKKNYQKINRFDYKTAYEINHKSFEIVYFQKSDHDLNVIYYLGHGKKELWEYATGNSNDSRRCLLYYHSFPKEILDGEFLHIDGLRIKILSELYIKLHYPKLERI